MADDDKRPGENDDDEEGTAAAPKSRKKWLLLGALMLVLAIIGVAVTLFVVGHFSAEDDTVAAEGAEGAESVEPPSQAAIYYPLTPEFISNYDVRGRQRFLKVEMTLMLREPDVIGAIELHMPALRNALVMLLRGQVYEELQTPEGKELLRQRSLLAVQAVLQAEISKPGVEQVLFTNLVMQ